MRASDVPIGSQVRGEILSTPTSVSIVSAFGAPRGPTRGSVAARKGPTNRRAEFHVPSGLTVIAGGLSAAPLYGHVLLRLGTTASYELCEGFDELRRAGLCLHGDEP